LSTQQARMVAGSKEGEHPVTMNTEERIAAIEGHLERDSRSHTSSEKRLWSALSAICLMLIGMVAWVGERNLDRVEKMNENTNKRIDLVASSVNAHIQRSDNHENGEQKKNRIRVALDDAFEDKIKKWLDDKLDSFDQRSVKADSEAREERHDLEERVARLEKLAERILVTIERDGK